MSHDRGISNEYEILQDLQASAEIFARLDDPFESELQLQAQLRQEFSDDVVRAALALRDCRQRAAAKFTRAGQMWFDRKGLEQATAEPVARHKAQRFHGQIWDYCSGIGSDALALAAQGNVTAVDINPAACLRTRWNADVYSLADRLTTVCADVTTLANRQGLVHIDPDRRAGSHGKVVRIEDYVPGLEFLEQMTTEFAGGAIKLSPASNFMGKFPDSEVELISLAGECKEATIWFGDLAGSDPYRATALPSGESIVGSPLDADTIVQPLGGILYDPDPAIVRSGLVNHLCEQTGLWRLDDAEEYLTADDPTPSAFVQGFRVLAELPNNTREIRGYFRDADFGQLEIKCRRIPISIEAVRRKIPLKGTRAGVLVFARIAGKARAIVCERC